MKKVKQFVRKYKLPLSVIFIVLVLGLIAGGIYLYRGGESEDTTDTAEERIDPAELSSKGDNEAAGTGFKELAEQEDELKGEFYEQSGREYWNAYKYQEALESYKLALAVYEEDNEDESILRVSARIAEVENLINFNQEQSFEDLEE